MVLNKSGFLTCVGIFFLAAMFTGNIAHGKESKESQVAPISDPNARSWQIIDEAMANKDPDKRREIVIAASLGGAYPKVFNFLNKALDDKKVEVRVAACSSLASFKDPGAIDPLKKAMKDPVPEVFFCAAQALWAQGDPMGEKVLLEVLGKEKGTTSGFLTVKQREAMASFNSTGRFFSTLFRLGIRFAPVPGLAMGMTSLQSLAADHKAGGQVLAALALAKGDDPESLQALVKALGDKDDLVRAAAVHSLAMRNDPSVQNALVPLLDDKSFRVQDRAAVAYLRLGKVAEGQAKAATTSAVSTSNKK